MLADFLRWHLCRIKKMTDQNLLIYLLMHATMMQAGCRIFPSSRPMRTIVLLGVYLALLDDFSQIAPVKKGVRKWPAAAV
jgi:hypothetical protein